MSCPELHMAQEFRDIDQNFFSFEDNIFIDCQFSNIVKRETQLGDATFLNCRFLDIDWHFCYNYGVKFIDCQFRICDLRGYLGGAVFVNCEFHQCKTGDNDYGVKTEWENAQAIDCKLFNTELPIVNCEEEFE